MKLLCKECGGGRYKIREISLIRDKGKINDNYYTQKNICMSCGTTTTHKMPFISDEGYRVIWNAGGNIHLHRKVMEMILMRPLKNGERVKFKNKDTRDCRPSNLELIKKKPQQRWRF